MPAECPRSCGKVVKIRLPRPLISRFERFIWVGKADLGMSDTHTHANIAANPFHICLRMCFGVTVWPHPAVSSAKRNMCTLLFLFIKFLKQPEGNINAHGADAHSIRRHSFVHVMLLTDLRRYCIL